MFFVITVFINKTVLANHVRGGKSAVSGVSLMAVMWDLRRGSYPISTDERL